MKFNMLRGFLALGVLFCASVSGSETDANSIEEQPLYLRLETPPAPVLTPAQALDDFRLAPGFVIEPVAVEPLVEDPVAIAWDELGHLYVVEMRGYMPDLHGTGEDEPVGAVVRLKDNDGDGRFDERQVMLDRLVLPRAVAVVNEGLLIAEPPNLWLCPSQGGDAATIDCRAKRSLGEYGNQPGSVEHAENGLLQGLDNWLYSAKSQRRLRLVAGELRSEATLFRGQWGIAQDDWGRLYYNTNSKLLLGDSYSAQAVIASGSLGGEGLNAPISQNDKLHAVRVNTGVNRAYVPGVLREDGRLNRPTSASGMAINRALALGQANFGHAFVAEPAANAVVQLALTRDGLVTRAEQVLFADPDWGQREFLASTDERFRPVDIKFGPDGAMYVVDMYRGVIQDHVFISEELRAQARERGLDRPLGMGRIWRVTRSNSEAVAPERPDDGRGWLQQLTHSNGWWRDTAQRLLTGPALRESRGVERGLRRFLKTGTPRPALHALWTLSGRDTLRRTDVQTALRHSAPEVQVAALEAGAQLLDAKQLLSVVEGATDPRVRQQGLLALAAHAAKADVQALLIAQLHAHADDAFVRTAVQAASLHNELELVQMLLNPSQGSAPLPAWSAQQEQGSNMLQRLTSQGLRNHPEAAGAWLELAYGEIAAPAEGVEPQRRWVLQALLEGLFEVSRDADFQRLVLAEPHPLFATTQRDLWPLVAKARRVFTWPGDTLAADAKPLTPAQSARLELGAEYFASRCATCHGAAGAGVTGLGPALADSSWVTGPAEVLARVVFNGLAGPIQVGQTNWDGVMPGHIQVPEFTDEVAAGLFTYLRRAWGHSARAVDPDFVVAQRAAVAARQQPWTAQELSNLKVHTHYQMYEGRYGFLRFVYTGRGLEVRTGVFNGPVREVKEDHFVFEPRQIPFEFVLDDAGVVSGVRMPSENGAVVVPRAGGGG